MSKINILYSLKLLLLKKITIKLTVMIKCSENNFKQVFILFFNQLKTLCSICIN